MKTCLLKSCKKLFAPTVPWQRYCTKRCTDTASRLTRARLILAGRKMKGLGRC